MKQKLTSAGFASSLRKAKTIPALLDVWDLCESGADPPTTSTVGGIMAAVGSVFGFGGAKKEEHLGPSHHEQEPLTVEEEDLLKEVVAVERPFAYVPASKVLTTIVVGSTGAGKTTFINQLTNYFRGGTLTNMKIAISNNVNKQTEMDFPRIVEIAMNDKTVSKTDHCTKYTFTEAGRKFEIIDSPGLADTRGLKYDELHVDDIIDVLSKENAISAIIIVVNGASPRMTNVRPG
jgi:GTP-binding protein EngB required for normal cell division